MRLRLEISLPEFLRCVDACNGAVQYSTPEGDLLNLKSQLSKYIFLAAANKEGSIILLSGQVICSNSSDLEKLRPYLTE